MKTRSKKIRFLVIAVAVFLVLVLGFKIMRPDNTNYRNKYKGEDLTTDVKGLARSNTYTQYLLKYKDVQSAEEDIKVNIIDDIAQSEDTEVYDNYEGAEKALYTGNDSSVTWNVTVPKDGFYNVDLEYMTVESRGVNIERALYINGELPFSGADTLQFSRLWTDGGKVKKDNQGNEIRAAQVEVYDWQESYCKDYLGYTADPYKFYLKAGNNTITLKAVNEPMVIKGVTLKKISQDKDYAQYIKEQPADSMSKAAKKYVQKIQGEDAVLRSDPSLYPKYDRSSYTTEPNSVTKTVLNYIGGESWSTAGQWIEWNFKVPEDGYYNITIKGRQNYARGSVSCRALYIDNKIPFEEVSSVGFNYSTEWNTLTLSDDEGTPYRFYLTAGTHNIRLEATLVGIGDSLNSLNDSVYRLNEAYRRILILTGATPDEYRDYNLKGVYPEVIKAMGLESKRLYKSVDDVVAYTGQKSDKIASAQTLAIQLEGFNKNPNKITVGLAAFKNNITSLGTSLQSMSQTKLDIDYLVVSGDNAKVKKVKETFGGKLLHEIKSFIATFTVDYNAVGDVYKQGDDNVVKVWIVSGRDQGTILKTMVDDTFVTDTGIKVNVEIVNAGALLSAVVAGRGPDVVLSVDSTQPVNYALRNAVEDLTQFDDCEQVLSAFYPSAYTSFEFENGIYAIPETQSYNMLFYRKDIMEELGLKIPQTWNDLINILPTIQGNNMSVGIPTVGNALTPNLSLLYSLIYQNGGTIYDDGNKTTAISNEAGVKAFTLYTSLYTDYSLPMEFDFVSRFRSGEMPIGIADFSTYNTLVVSAPEIRGLWDFTLMPGTERKDSSGKTYIDRSVHSQGNCCMMIKTDNEVKKQNAWKFMKWWTDTDTQVRFGRELEALMGASARYATANVKAFEQLSWSAEQVKVLKEQWKWTVGFREVAGGYYTPRHITNAARKVIYNKEDPRETLLDYARTINEEITKKRTEFGLPTD